LEFAAQGGFGSSDLREYASNDDLLSLKRRESPRDGHTIALIGRLVRSTPSPKPIAVQRSAARAQAANDCTTSG